MRRKFLIYVMIAISAIVITSCGAQKKASNYNQELYKSQQQWSEAAKASATQTPARKMREMEPCEELAYSKDFAAVGTATSYVEKVARDEAVRNARYELGRMLESAVEGAAEDYSKDTTKNKKNLAETGAEAIEMQFFSQALKNTRVIKTTVYDLADGQIQVYACVEMNMSQENFYEQVDNVLSQDDVWGVDYDKNAFRERMSARLQEYKDSKTK